MKCGYCKKRFRGIGSLKRHQAEGCSWNREAWVKHYRAKQAGRSGRRILSQAFPRTYKPKPMSEEAKERLRELAENRKGMNVKRRRK